jgi:hypothetical protein
MNMPTLTLTLGTLEALGLSRADFAESTLPPDVKLRALAFARIPGASTSPAPSASTSWQVEKASS